MSTQPAGDRRIYHVLLAFAGHQLIEADSHVLQEEKLVLSLDGKVVAEFDRAKIESWWHE